MKSIHQLKNPKLPLLPIKPKTKIYSFNKNYSTSNKIYQETNELVKRLCIQTARRPSILITSLIQPLLWLLLFGALFQKSSVHLFDKYTIQYGDFLTPGITIFTAFTSSINAGLPIIFDREFGFLNRILVCPIIYKQTLIIASIFYIWFISIVQISTIIFFSKSYLQNIQIINHAGMLISIVTIVIIHIASISILNAFILPGHIEFIALTLVINLPTLFSSTALAPLSSMPNWLRILSCLNPLTYAIEIVRYIYLKPEILQIKNNIIDIGWYKLNIQHSTSILISISILSLILINRVIKYKYD
uniref:ABC transmembrane type-2 domain-containing protein n=1 Tax=Bostrychia moritziana TaxID=103713 RepID=A0A1Z1M6V7_BOSMO|nr:hypothetical protein [Bostrychia moritziana]ARW61729.1 hypothetical protein [Bostrychia moritziana]